MEGQELRLDLAVPDIRCGGCIRRIERGLGELAMVSRVRVNLSERRVSIVWRGGSPQAITAALEKLGFAWHPITGEAGEQDKAILRDLIKALAVAGFASGNIMLLSVSIWAGADAATRDLFHWISALIAVPAVLYAGQPFFRSAGRALIRRRLNMDVPISLAVCLALAMSLVETANGRPHAYFDAAVTLLFFLLVGRTLDHLMRGRARRAIDGLADLAVEGATVIGADGAAEYRRLETIAVGECLRITAGERVPMDVRVRFGASEADCALVTGESVPVPVGPGTMLYAGTLNLSGVIEAEAVGTAEQSFLARMRELMRSAEETRAPYRRLADRMADIYAPAVHGLALVTFAGWVLSTGDWRAAVMAAIAVLIITCPCALGLAVPIVQVVAAGRLFEKGVMLRSGAALERLAGIDQVLFDKTGTVTLGRPELVNGAAIDPAILRLAGALAGYSTHPLSRSIVAAAPADAPTPVCTEVREVAGKGLEGQVDGHAVRLGRLDWTGGNAGDMAGNLGCSTAVGVALDGEGVAVLRFQDAPRADAGPAIRGLFDAGLDVEICSGDRQPAVEALAAGLGIERYAGGMPPAEKLCRLQELQAAGHRVLMVGDGLNDSPVLAAADVSMVPASAADIGRERADLVFLRPSLSAVPFAHRVARASVRLIKQNFALAIAYNCIAVPVAMAGLATPLVAAIAMSSSSVLVVLNGLRLMLLRDRMNASFEPAPKSRTAGLEQEARA